MAYAFDDDYTHLPPPPVRAEVEADIVDWKARLADLMEQLRQWSTEVPGIDCLMAETEKLEPKMQLVGIDQPVVLPMLLIDKRPEGSVTPPAEKSRPRSRSDRGWLSVWPDARWVIGTRGQVWLSTSDWHETLADIGRPGVADWRYTQHGDFLRPLTKESFQSILKSLR